MQPYFLPYIGTYQLAYLVDKYVLFDDVNYRRGFLNRNTIWINGKERYLNVRLHGASQNKLIQHTLVMDSIVDIISRLNSIYKTYPYYKDLKEILNSLSSVGRSDLGEFNGNIIKTFSRHLGLKTEFIYSSDLNDDKSLRGADRIVNICRLLTASTYINPQGGRDLYKADDFAKINCKLRFFSPVLIDNNFHSIVHDIATFGLDKVKENVPLGSILA
jgi:hypothetical protein